MLRNALPKRAFIEDVKEIVASHMSGLDYETADVRLTADQVKVILLPYDPDDVSLDTPFVVEIKGLDYPTRMLFLPDRLRSIGVGIKKVVVDFVDPSLADYEAPIIEPPKKLVSLVFSPVQPTTWVSV